MLFIFPVFGKEKLGLSCGEEEDHKWNQTKTIEEDTVKELPYSDNCHENMDSLSFHFLTKKIGKTRSVSIPFNINDRRQA